MTFSCIMCKNKNCENNRKNIHICNNRYDCGFGYRYWESHADRIRSMSDEELAEFLKAEMFNDFKPSCKNSTFFSAESKPECNTDCISCIKNWLRQPAEDKPCTE